MANTSTKLFFDFSSSCAFLARIRAVVAESATMKIWVLCFCAAVASASSASVTSPRMMTAVNARVATNNTTATTHDVPRIHPRGTEALCETCTDAENVGLRVGETEGLAEGITVLSQHVRYSPSVFGQQKPVVWRCWRHRQHARRSPFPPRRP